MPQSRRKAKGPTQVEALKHDDSRKNIPTVELRDFAAKHERNPPVKKYERDPSLDPQLVWKGKDEQDSQDLAVVTVPIYIQEKIEPKAIIEDLRRDSIGREDEMRLFADFNGLEPEDVLDFYKHGVHWSNRMILGDSLLVMNSLAEKENLKGQVQMIYLDPPYGIKFGSNWQVSTRNRDVRDGKDTDLVRQPEQVRAFRDTWEKGIHSYLSYLRDRLVVARELLTESGSVFVQIGDENVHLVRSLLDEVFGSENSAGEIMFATTSGRSSITLDAVVDRILWYAKRSDTLRYRQLYVDRSSKTLGEQYTLAMLDDGSIAPIEGAPSVARRMTHIDLSSQGAGRPEDAEYSVVGQTFTVASNRHWSHTLEGRRRLELANRLLPLGNTLRGIKFQDDDPMVPLNNVWSDTVVSGFGRSRIFVVETLPLVVQRCLLMTTDPGDLVLDPTCGSGTTAYVAEQWGRRWITIDTSRVALALARTRLMAARFPYYLLADSPEGRNKEAELTGGTPATSPTSNDVKQGFVYKRVPHVTLKSIANNPDVTEGMSREEIDAAIARHAEQELLVDQPYEDNRRVRVTGRFTVESLSPHRVLDPEEQDQPESEIEAERDPERLGYVPTILANLRKAGVQNRIKNERLTFDTLEPFAGEWIQASGTYTDNDGNTKKVAVSVGPEHGTVGPLQIKNAAIEAVRGLGHDVLIVCGFAFDAQADETAKQFGELVVLPTRMNPDLMMGDDLLKKTGAANLFMVFGEPDVNIKEEGGQIVVELRGLDVYDPTTGEIRSNSTDDIACWFIDTNYNRESFFVRHAYFTGADQPYDRLKRALRAEIDEQAWATLYSTTSRPFPKSDTGRIAVKVINHYGDEVMKVYEVE